MNFNTLTDITLPIEVIDFIIVQLDYQDIVCFSLTSKYFRTYIFNVSETNILLRKCIPYMTLEYNMYTNIEIKTINRIVYDTAKSSMIKDLAESEPLFINSLFYTQELSNLLRQNIISSEDVKTIIKYTEKSAINIESRFYHKYHNECIESCKVILDVCIAIMKREDVCICCYSSCHNTKNSNYKSFNYMKFYKDSITNMNLRIFKIITKLFSTQNYIYELLEDYNESINYIHLYLAKRCTPDQYKYFKDYNFYNEFDSYTTRYMYYIDDDTMSNVIRELSIQKYLNQMECCTVDNSLFRCEESQIILEEFIDNYNNQIEFKAYYRNTIGKGYY